MKCERCLNIMTCRKFKTYNPLKKEHESHYLCYNCVLHIVDNYFSPIKTGNW